MPTRTPNRPTGYAAVVLCAMALLGPLTHAARAQPVERIAFGSCFHQGRPAPIWDAIADSRPDVLLMLGDNVYADTEDMDVMRACYAELAAVEGFQRLRRTSAVLATWDDHDYGRNDAGADYPMKAEAQEVFLDFFGEPDDTERRRTPGVYDAEVFGEPGERVQIILLDTRTFRGPLDTGPPDRTPGGGVGGRYVPRDDPGVTMLGEAQWAWLEERLREPAELRIIASSIQVVAEDHRYEKWANLPLERARLLRLIRETRAGGVLFVSGDRHRAELSVFDPARAGAGSGRGIDVGYPLHDLTSSALNQGRGRWTNELNRHRWGNQYFDSNSGSIRIDWSADDPVVSLELRDERGRVVLRKDVALSELRPE